MKHLNTRFGRLAASLSGSCLLAFSLLCVSVVSHGRHHSHVNTGGEPGQFDYYILSLSWAPTYCLTHAGEQPECSGRGYGFVLHGLWPQYAAGGYPSYCPSVSRLSDVAAARGRTIYPSVQLMRHEWQEHGTCSGMEALDYFATADRATAVLRIPAALDAPRADQTLQAGQIISLFRSANPQLPEGALTLSCSRNSLSEVRVCLSRDLVPRACGRGVHSSCPRTSVRVPAFR